MTDAFTTFFHAPELATLRLLVAFVYGSCLGSFLNVCIWRIPRGESIVTGGSHCPKCGHPIRWFDNLPLISFCVLRGKCRDCHAPISPRYVAVELLTGALFLALAFEINTLNLPPAVYLVGGAMILLALGAIWIDAKWLIIPDLLTYPAMVVGLLAAGFFPELFSAANWRGGVLCSALSGLIPGAALTAFALLGKLICRREVIGWGDIKFIIACGILLGGAGALFTLLVGSLSASVFGIAMAIVCKRPLRRLRLAFGPFLAMAALVWLYFGLWVAAFYLELVR